MRPWRYGSDVVRRALPPGALLAAIDAALSDDVDRRPACGGAGAGQDSSTFFDDRDGQMDGGQKPGLLIAAPAGA
jgi:hypothetical protein